MVRRIKQMKAKTFLVCLLRRLAQLVLTALIFSSCTEGAASFDGNNQKEVPGRPETPVPEGNNDFQPRRHVPDPLTKTGTGNNADNPLSLERIAELERAGSYFPGLGLAESALREKAADFTGAAVAAYKELSWAYGYGSASRKQVEEGLENAINLSANLPVINGSAPEALLGCKAFAAENWKRAQESLKGAFPGLSAGTSPDMLPADEEPDSFLRWMLLVCALEQNENNHTARSAYSAIRARYALFPEYWYRGARAFSSNESIAASYAEQCINISPKGPFAEDCRKILAYHLGLSPNGKQISGDIHSGVRTRVEIENIIRGSVSMNNPSVLEELYPLMALPENPYTLYAMGALKALAALPEFRNFFIEGAGKSPGRLGERLSYISRG